jgi:O-antigen ligase
MLNSPSTSSFLSPIFTTGGLIPRLAIFFLLFSLIIGQSLRFPLPGQGGGLLVSDLAVVFTLLTALFFVLFRHKSPITSYWLLVTSPFFIWSLFSLLINASNLDLASLSVAFAYWLRLATNLLLLPALLIIFANKKNRRFAKHGLLITILILILLGFLQLLLIPNLSGEEGWDPHQSRLVSTWLDPNLFGGFLIIVIPFILYVFPFPLSFLFFLPFITLLFTQSRSSLLALILSFAIFSPLIIFQYLRRVKSKYFLPTLALLTLILTVFIVATIPLKHRLIGLFTIDDTVQLRLGSLQQAQLLAVDHYLFGAGYNAYQFTAHKAGLISNFNIHSRAGADNSWLTLWVTTGLPGLILFLFPWLIIFHFFFRQWIRGRNQALVTLLAITVLFIHSQFLNSFLYSHLFITLIIITALEISATSGDKEQFRNYTMPRAAQREGFQALGNSGRLPLGKPELYAGPGKDPR